MVEKIFLSRAQSRMVDKIAIEEYKIPGIVLMENAGRGIVESLLAYVSHARVVICCGKGNNGGDGFVIARHLVNLGFDVEILLFAPIGSLRGDAKTNFIIATNFEIPIQVISESNFRHLDGLLANADWVVDALFGTGLQGDMSMFFQKVVRAINKSAKQVLAVDIPSGLDCDTGQVLGDVVRATTTSTMVSSKQGFNKLDACQYLGNVNIVDIGVPQKLVSQIASE